MKQRVITALIGIIIILPIILYGSWPFTLVVYVLATVALYELFRMFKMKRPIYLIISALFLWIFIYSQQHTAPEILSNHLLELIIIYMMVLLTIIVLSKNKFTLDDASRLLLAILFIGFSFYYMIEIRTFGLHVFLFVLFIIWATDSGAYFIGRSLGRKKLWPEISPNKTIGGAIGGIFFAIIVGALFYIFAPFEQSFLSLLFISVLISIFGQLGDLVASAMKRTYAIKDFGRLFPGHGGVLDRLDSFIFVLLLLQIMNFF